MAQHGRDVELFLRGLAARSEMVVCPLGAFKVAVTRCEGSGDCAEICSVGVFISDDEGRCTVVNDALCFGCMACVAQCVDGGVNVVPAENGHVAPEDLLR